MTETPHRDVVGEVLAMQSRRLTELKTGIDATREEVRQLGRLIATLTRENHE